MRRLALALLALLVATLALAGTASAELPDLLDACHLDPRSATFNCGL